MSFIGYEIKGIDDINPIYVSGVRRFEKHGNVFGFFIGVKYPGDLRSNFKPRLKFCPKTVGEKSQRIGTVRCTNDRDTEIVYFFSRREFFDYQDAYYAACLFQGSLMGQIVENRNLAK